MTEVIELEDRYQANMELTERQTLAWDILTDTNLLAAVLYGGAKGGGKSHFFCIWVLCWSRYLAKLFGLEPNSDRRKLVPLGFMGRKIGTDFNKTTLETWTRVIPPQAYRICAQDKEIIIDDCCKVHYGGLDKQETINKFNSAEYAFCAIDQAEETERKDVEVLQASLRLKINGMQPPYKELYTANPADCWLLPDFIDNPPKENYYVPALPTDNEYLPDNYIARLDKSFRNSPGLLAAYKYGDWTALKSSNKLISLSQINALKGITLNFPIMKRCIAIDPSTGGDKCTLKIIEDYKVTDEEDLIAERDTTVIAAKARMMMEEHQITHVFIDSIGVGYGVACDIRKMCKYAKVHFVNTSEEAYDKSMFYNRRAEIWWNVSLKIHDKRVAPIENEELARQLTNVLFTLRNGRILLEDKNITKVRLGCSPDDADAYVIGIDGMDRIEAWQPIRDPYAMKQQLDMDINPMVV